LVDTVLKFVIVFTFMVIIHNMKRILLLLLVVIFYFAVGYSQPGKVVLIQTTLGNIKIKLYDETPKHRDNFLTLVNQKYYDSILFHRVIESFMIQTGDPNSKHATQGARLGNGGPGYTIPAEFNPNLIHKKGALAAARTGDNVNPLQASSGSQFYIVQGKPLTDVEITQNDDKIRNMIRYKRMKTYLSLPENKAMLDAISSSQGMKQDSLVKIIGGIIDTQYKDEPVFSYTPQQREIYKTLGGTPRLDTSYTVFGEVIEGLDVLDKIAAVKTGEADRPVEDVRIITMLVIN